MERIIACAVIALLSGCAHVAEIIDNQSIETSTLKRNEHQIISMTGDRRLIRTRLSDAEKGKPGHLMVCGETQADAMSARSTDSSLNVVGKGSGSDSIAERLTVTYPRTELSDIVRQLSWQICNANMNGAIGNDVYRMALLDLQEGAIQVLRTRAVADSSVALKALQDANAARIAKELEAAAVDKAAREKRIESAIANDVADCKAKNQADPVKLAKCV